jgi:hypothetical protein
MINDLKQQCRVQKKDSKRAYKYFQVIQKQSVDESTHIDQIKELLDEKDE